MPDKLLVVPDADVTDGAPTTLANAQIMDEGTLSGLTPSGTFRAFLLATAVMSPLITTGATPPQAITVDEGASTGTFTTVGGYRIWTGQDGDQLVITGAGEASALLQAGGGAGGYRAGGGGAGGQTITREFGVTPLDLTVGTFTATVGAGAVFGGAAAGDTTFAGLTATAGPNGGDAISDGVAAFNGSGASAGATGGATTGGGFPGGDGNLNNNSGGGGGGSGGGGGTGGNNEAGVGGQGLASPVPGESGIFYGPGGAGGSSYAPQPGGDTGGGDGPVVGTSYAGDGQDGYGAGGAGGADVAGWRDGGNGGSGIVKVWWPI